MSACGFMGCTEVGTSNIAVSVGPLPGRQEQMEIVTANPLCEEHAKALSGWLDEAFGPKGHVVARLRRSESG